MFASPQRPLSLSRSPAGVLATLLLSLGYTAGASALQETGRVISVQPLVQAVGTPMTVCTSQEVEVQQPKTGAGSALGAVTGAVIGGSLGQGRGAGAAAMAGAVVGSVVGDQLEKPGSQVQQVQNCGEQTRTEYKTVAYLVQYEYDGRQYNAQLSKAPQDGSIDLIVHESNGGVPVPVDLLTVPAAVVSAPPVVVQQPTVVYRYSPPVQVYYGWPGPRWGWHGHYGWGWRY